jgi:hypothetical protein
LLLLFTLRLHDAAWSLFSRRRRTPFAATLPPRTKGARRSHHKLAFARPARPAPIDNNLKSEYIEVPLRAEQITHLALLFQEKSFLPCKKNNNTSVYYTTMGIFPALCLAPLIDHSSSIFKRVSLSSRINRRRTPRAARGKIGVAGCRRKMAKTAHASIYNCACNSVARDLQITYALSADVPRQKSE